MIADATTGGLSIASTGVIATYQAIPDALQLQPRPIAVGGFS